MGFLDTFYQQNLPSRAVTVYLYLRERSNKDGTCFPSIPTVSRDTGLSEATVKRAIGDLIAAGWLQKEPRLRRNGARSSNIESGEDISRKWAVAKNNFPAKTELCFRADPCPGSP